MTNAGDVGVDPAERIAHLRLRTFKRRVIGPHGVGGPPIRWRDCRGVKDSGPPQLGRLWLANAVIICT
jgi:hypothetical protein